MADPRVAIILGNGSSLDAMPETFWEACRESRTMCVGTNRALALGACGSLDFDALVLRDSYRQLWLDQKLGSLYHQTLWKPSRAWKVAPQSNRHSWCDEYLPDEPAADGSPPGLPSRSDSVVLTAILWAWRQGIRRIFLAGVDYRPGHAEMVQPYDAPTRGDGGCRPEQFPHIARQFSQATSAIQAAGGTLHNLSPQSRLDDPPAATLRDLCKALQR